MSGPPSRRLLLLLAAISGVLSYAALRFGEDSGGLAVDWGAGLLFGILVLAPQGRSWWRRAALVVASALVYRGAVWLAVELASEREWSEVLACLLAGALAAPLLALLTLPLLGGRLRSGPTLLALVAGTAGGALIGLATAGGDDQVLRFDLPLLAGYLIWQVGYTAAYGGALSGSTAP
jgi:hypothetical protein